MNRDKLNQQLFESMSRASKRIGSSMYTSAGLGDLSHPQIGVLFALYKNRGEIDLKVKDIADHMGVTSAAITQFSDDLVNKGLLERKINSEDRRQTNLFLTDKTDELFKKLKKIRFDRLRPFFDDFTNDELEQFIHLLEKIKIDRK